jgi:hypothetical protein
MNNSFIIIPRVGNNFFGIRDGKNRIWDVFPGSEKKIICRNWSLLITGKASNSILICRLFVENFRPNLAVDPHPAKKSVWLRFEAV